MSLLSEHWEQSLSLLLKKLRQESFSSPEVDQFLKTRSETENFMIGCSGGADSVFLSLWSLARYEHLKSRIWLVYIDHGQRESGTDDGLFVKDIAAKLGFPFLVKRANLAKCSSEAVLRKARNSCFEEIGREINADVLFLGHHLNDVAESMIMRIGTGYGLAGMSGLRSVKPFNKGLTRVRPLLGVRADTIRNLLTEAGLNWREDESNSSDDYTRNRLRKNIIPSLDKAIPQDFLSGVARSHYLLREADSAISIWVHREFAERELRSDDNISLQVNGLELLPKAIIRGLIWRLWAHSEDASNALSGSAVDKIVDALATNSFFSIQVSKSIVCRRIEEMDGAKCPRITFQTVSLLVKEVKFSTQWAWPSGPLFLPDGAVLRAERIRSDRLLDIARSANVKNSAIVAISEEILSVSSWENGDVYQPLGAPGRRKLQDLFTDRKILVEQRRKLPVIRSLDGEIIYVPCLGIAETRKIQPKNKIALRLTYQHH